MASTAKSEPDWGWPQDLPGQWADDSASYRRKSASKSEAAHPPPSTTTNATHESESRGPQGAGAGAGPAPQAQEQQRRFYRPRTCRICLETVLPTFHPPSTSLPGVFQSSPSVTYESEDGGRLVRPCLCKGTQKYVHEACLTAWRMQNPLEKRNYWQCPTCRYSYRLERMTWGRWISSTSQSFVSVHSIPEMLTFLVASQISLTFFIFLVATFILGYVADPIINLYLDPYGTISSVPSQGSNILLPEDEPITWIEHFVKGLASLGLLGFAKFILTLSPYQWFNMRASGTMGGGRGGNTGRDRMQQISWIAVLVGVVTVVWVRVPAPL